jgi:probable HAF family extracellular repeat protein
VLHWDQSTNARTNLGQYRGNTRGRGINDAGDVAGQSDGGVPFFKPNGGLFLGLALAPFGAAFVTGLNNIGTVAGWAQAGGIQRAVKWPDHASPLLDLGSLGGDISRAEAINDAGDIVGWSEITPGNPLRHAVLWPATGGVIDLATWPGHCAGSSVALGINNAGVIVGHCDAIPVLWTAREGMRYLPNPRGSGEPRGINDRLEIVGTAPTGFGGALWKLDNNPPVANPRGPSTGNEGELLVFDGSGSFDADSDALTYDWSFGDGGTGTGIGPAHAYDDNGVYQITLTVTDARGAVSPTASMGVSIGNVAPTITSLVLPPDPVAVGTTVTASGSFTDPSSLDTHTATVDWDDGGGALAATVEGGARTFTASRAFTAAGVYTVTVTATDDDHGSTTLVGTD